MSKKFRAGSEGAASQKREKIFYGGAALIYVLILLSMFVFNTTLHEAVKVTSGFMNVVGFLFIVVSYGLLYKGDVIPALEKSAGLRAFFAAFALGLGIYLAANNGL